MDWDSLPLCNSSRSFNRSGASYSQGRANNAEGGFVWIHPWTGSFSSATEARLRRPYGKRILFSGEEAVQAGDRREPDLHSRLSSPSNLDNISVTTALHPVLFSPVPNLSTVVSSSPDKQTNPGPAQTDPSPPEVHLKIAPEVCVYMNNSLARAITLCFQLCISWQSIDVSNAQQS